MKTLDPTSGGFIPVVLLHCNRLHSLSPFLSASLVAKQRLGIGMPPDIFLPSLRI